MSFPVAPTPKRVVQSKDLVILVLAALIAFLIIFDGIAIFLLFRQQREIKSLRAQQTVQPTNHPKSHRSTPDPAPQNPSAAVAAEDEGIPGRYRWIKAEEEKGIITLFPDHTFANEKGEKFRVYRWEQAADGLVLTWQRGPVRFTVVESPGVYIAPRPNKQTERIEKIE